MLLRPEGPSRTPQTIYPNMGGRPTREQIQPQGRDNITTDTKSCTHDANNMIKDSKQMNEAFTIVFSLEGQTDLDEVMVRSRHRGVPWFGQDVLVVLRVNEHAQSQVILHFLWPGLVLPLPSTLLVILHSQHCLHIHSFHLHNKHEGKPW